ncbi:hypothetical protein Dda_4735 [Drechslerella dactyloides]|uniref:C2H2-type domain-containing protein n=1 Tax=Drechslerella dactyloides TaxID=74499 RepID=A0AAD6IYV7_DREDA|nr:hypothetical protein Dda_4735 [Drechslerella dactyloides]
MAPYRNYDSDSDDSGDEDVVLVTNSVPVTLNHKQQYACTHCIERPQVFDSYNALVEHKVRVGHHYCRKCDEDFPDRDAIELHVLNSNKHITCYLCNKEFRSESGLEVHMNQAHRQTSGAMCPKCHESFSTQSGLLQHIEGNLCPGGLRRGDVHSAINTHQTLTNEALRKELEGGTRESFTREQQGSELINSFSHFKIYDKRDGGELSDDNRIEANVEWYDKSARIWNCPIKGCGKKFPLQHSFEQHLNSATHASKSFLCPGCKKKFPSSSAILQHVESGMCRIIRMSDYHLVKSGLTIPLDTDSKASSQGESSQKGKSPEKEGSEIPPLSTVGSIAPVADEDDSELGSDYWDRPLSTII